MNNLWKINTFYGAVITGCIMAMLTFDLGIVGKAVCLTLMIGAVCVMRGRHNAVEQSPNFDVDALDHPSEDAESSYQNNAASDTQKPDSPDEQRVTPEQVEEARKRQQNMNT